MDTTTNDIFGNSMPQCLSMETWVNPSQAKSSQAKPNQTELNRSKPIQCTTQAAARTTAVSMSICTCFGERKRVTQNQISIHEVVA